MFENQRNDPEINGSQTSDDVLAHFKAEKKVFVSILLQTEGRRRVSTCARCRDPLLLDTGIYSCQDCLGKPQLCADCVLDVHILNPFHRVQKWTGDYFKHFELTTLPGFAIYLGHEGFPCPSQSTYENLPPELQHPPDQRENLCSHTDARSHNPKTMTVGHITGFHRVCVVPCKCAGSPEVWQQMLWRGLWPATLLYPETTFTVDCLHLARNLHVEGQSSESGVHTLLQNRTSWGEVEEPLPVRTPIFGLENMLIDARWQNKVKELRAVLREYRACMNIVDFGFGHSGTEPGPGELCWECPRCPRPDVNLPPGWETDIENKSGLETQITLAN